MGKITPVILCGGKGTRLWPRSRAALPKPFLPLVGSRTLFEEALERCADPAQFAAPLVVTGAALLEHVTRQAPGVATIVEPVGKNTAPAIALAAHRLPPETVMLVCPSDHHIADVAAFCEAAASAAALAGDGWLVALGIAPTRPETGYGYIRRGESLAGGWKVASFVEKPAQERAEAFLAAGDYCWNGGIFALKAGAYLAELERQRPAMAEAVTRAVAGGETQGQIFAPDAASFAGIAAESIDYAVMEGTDHAALVAAEMGWSDIGNWQAVREARASEADAAGNIVRGRAELLGCRNALVESDGPRVSVVGLDGVIVVVDGDEVLVTSVAGAPDVGKLKGAGEQ